MRFTGLLAFSLVLSLFAWVSVVAASNQTSPASPEVVKASPVQSAAHADTAAPSSTSADSFDKRYGILRSDPDSDTDLFSTPAQRYFSRMKREEDGTCLKLRTYKVARDDRDSDSTHLVDYFTCQRASKFQMRSSDGAAVPAKK